MYQELEFCTWWHQHQSLSKTSHFDLWIGHTSSDVLYRTNKTEQVTKQILSKRATRAFNKVINLQNKPLNRFLSSKTLTRYSAPKMPCQHFHFQERWTFFSAHMHCTATAAMIRTDVKFTDTIFINLEWFVKLLPQKYFLLRKQLMLFSFICKRFTSDELSQVWHFHVYWLASAFSPLRIRKSVKKYGLIIDILTARQFYKCFETDGVGQIPAMDTPARVITFANNNKVLKKWLNQGIWNKLIKHGMIARQLVLVLGKGIRVKVLK